MQGRTFITTSPEETEALGCRLGALLVAPARLWLFGDLGSGKTCFVRGLAAGLGVPADEPVTSPTYALMHHYRGRCDLYHFDLYRLSGQSELDEIGFDEFAESAGVTVVEWSERIDTTRADGLRILFSLEPDDATRRIEISAGSVRDKELLDRL